MSTYCLWIEQTKSSNNTNGVSDNCFRYLRTPAQVLARSKPEYVPMLTTSNGGYELSHITYFEKAYQIVKQEQFQVTSCFNNSHRRISKYFRL